MKKTRSFPAPGLPSHGIAAHRGGCTDYPENTLAAFRAALRLGASMIELDLRRSADGAIVVLHDAKVDRTTNGRGRLNRLELSEIRALDAGSWKHARFAGERIPTLEEVLGIVPRHVWLNLQIKYGEPIAADVARRLAAAGRLNHAFLACGASAAREAREAEPRILICGLERKWSRSAYITHCIDSGADFIQFHYLRGLPGPGLVARAAEAGLRVNFVCNPRRPQLVRAWQAGIHFPLVDDLAAGLATSRIAPGAAFRADAAARRGLHWPSALWPWSSPQSDPGV
jgi:glycerophosphoryl diester phosphodiesterase